MKLCTRRINSGTLLTMVAAMAANVMIGCASQNGRSSSLSPALAALPEAQQLFWLNLQSMCGMAFEGRVVEDTTDSPDFAGRTLVMHVRRCDDQRILVPFHVGDNRSRTWVFTHTGSGLRLKHDHRHEDGSEDDLTQYGGDTESNGSSHMQEFHADAHTASLIAAAVTNVWTVELVPGRVFAYALRREGTPRRFRAEFDLTRPIAPPPPPWGFEDR